MESIDIITIILSSSAIVVAALSYFQASNNHKRELRIEKLEQIIEILHTLNGNYQYFEDTYFYKTRYLFDDLDTTETELYTKQVIALIKTSEDIDLRNKLSKLYVLNNSYLPQDLLQDKISVFISVYTSIAENTISKPFDKLQLPFTKFPKRWELSDFTNEILKGLIKEMDLGYNENFKYNFDYEVEFKSKYKL